MKIVFTLIACCTASLAAAQTAPPCVPYTAASSAVWLNSVKSQPLNEQIIAVRERFTCDASTREIQSHNDRIIIDLRRENDPRPEGAPLLYVVDGWIIAHDSTAQFFRLATVKSVKSINVFNGNEASALWGSLFRNGAVAITTYHPIKHPKRR